MTAQAAGLGEAATGESAAAAGAVGLWLRQGSLFRRSLCARDRRAGAGCPEQPAGPGRAVPRQEALCERVDDSLPLVLPCLLLKLPAGGRTCGVGSDSFNVVLFLNTHTRRHTRTQAYFQARLWFVGFFFFLLEAAPPLVQPATPILPRGFSPWVVFGSATGCLMGGPGSGFRL